MWAYRDFFPTFFMLTRKARILVLWLLSDQKFTLCNARCIRFKQCGACASKTIILESVRAFIYITVFIMISGNLPSKLSSKTSTDIRLEFAPPSLTSGRTRSNARRIQCWIFGVAGQISYEVKYEILTRSRALIKNFDVGFRVRANDDLWIRNTCSYRFLDVLPGSAVPYIVRTRAWAWTRVVKTLKTVVKYFNWRWGRILYIRTAWLRVFHFEKQHILRGCHKRLSFDALWPWKAPVIPVSHFIIWGGGVEGLEKHQKQFLKSYCRRKTRAQWN